jgi:hypothetical protein
MGGPRPSQLRRAPGVMRHSFRVSVPLAAIGRIRASSCTNGCDSVPQCQRRLAAVRPGLPERRTVPTCRMPNASSRWRTRVEDYFSASTSSTLSADHADTALASRYSGDRNGPGRGRYSYRVPGVVPRTRRRCHGIPAREWRDLPPLAAPHRAQPEGHSPRVGSAIEEHHDHIIGKTAALSDVVGSLWHFESDKR